MTKRAEYNIKFLKVKSPLGGINYIFDTSNAIGNYKCLSFIKSLYKEEVIGLAQDINRIVQGQPYDPDFLTSSEVYDIFNVHYTNQNFLVDGVFILNANNLLILLNEWIDFLNT